MPRPGPARPRGGQLLLLATFGAASAFQSPAAKEVVAHSVPLRVAGRHVAAARHNCAPALHFSSSTMIPSLFARLHMPSVQLRGAAWRGGVIPASLSAIAPRCRPAPAAGVRMSSPASGRDRGVGGGEASSSRRDIRVFLRPPLDASAGGTVLFSSEQGHYLRKVMRVTEGSEIKVFDGFCGEWWCRLDFVDKKAVRGVLTEQRREMETEPDVWMVFAPVKGDGTEVIVQKATELGASRIVPVLTDRTVVKAVRWDRLTHISLEAAEQCERLSAPELEMPQPLAALVADWPSDRWLVLCDETASGRASSAEALQQIPPGSSCAVVVGPEGGWTPKELDLLKSVPNVASLGLGSPAPHRRSPPNPSQASA